MMILSATGYSVWLLSERWKMAADRFGGGTGDGFAGEERIESVAKIVFCGLGPALAVIGE
jgi:hypothetical protein